MEKKARALQLIKAQVKQEWHSLRTKMIVNLIKEPHLCPQQKAQGQISESKVDNYPGKYVETSTQHHANLEQPAPEQEAAENSPANGNNPEKQKER